MPKHENRATRDPAFDGLPGTPEVWQAVTLDLATLDVRLADETDAWLTVCLKADGAPVALEAHAEPDSGARVIAIGCAAPAAGPPRLPARIEVEEGPLATALRARFAGTGVEILAVAEAPLARGMAAELVAGLAAPPLPAGSYADAGVPAPIARALFEAARTFHQARPWRVLADGAPLEIHMPDRNAATAVVLGAGGEVFGLVLFDHAADVAAICAGEATRAFDVPALSLTFGLIDDVPPALAEEARRAKWPVASARAFPLALRTGGDPEPARFADPAEVGLLVLALRAVAAFCGRHARALRAGDAVDGGEAVAAVGGERVIVRLRRLADTDSAADDYGVGPDPDAPAQTDLFDGDGGPADRTRGGFLPELDRIRDLTTSVPDSRALVRRLRWSFFLAGDPAYAEDEHEYQRAVFRFLEWVVFAAPIPPDGRTLARRAIDHARDLAPTERVRLAAIAQPRYGVYAVRKVERDAGLTLHDLVDGTAFRVRERSGTHQLKRSHVLLGPIFPDGDGLFVLGGSCLAYPELDTRGLARPPEARNADFAPALEHVMHGASTDWIQQLATPGELRRAYDDFAGALRGAGTPLPGLARLQRLVRERDSLVEVIREAAAAVTWWTEAEASVFVGLLQRLWNLTPRRELGGRSPDQMHSGAAGKAGRSSGKQRRR